MCHFTINLEKPTQFQQWSSALHLLPARFVYQVLAKFMQMCANTLNFSLSLPISYFSEVLYL